MKYDKLIDGIQGIDTQLQNHVRSAVNKSLILRNWCVGAFIQEFEQNGEDRAAYGQHLLQNLTQDLKDRKIPGLGISTLKNCRQLYRFYPQIGQSLIGKFNRNMLPEEIRQSVIGELDETKENNSSHKVINTLLSSDQLFKLTWTHLIEMIRLENPLKRTFYEVECLKGNWSVRQLKRQIDSLLFERTSLSNNKKEIIKRAHLQTKNSNTMTMDIIRDPYVLEFVGLADKASYSEDDLETALLDHLQSFLLELGNGFCFESRQKRITVGNEHDRVDLVFYHRRLRCHILVDLKIRAFSHGDAGQMNFYLNYFKDQEMLEGDNPPVGIILCSDKEGTKVEYATAGMDNQLFVSRYLIELPNPEELKAFIERDRHFIEEEVAKVEE